MSKHDIRLRRQKFLSRGAERFRNYGAVLERHEKEMKIRKIVRVFTFLFIIMIIVMLILIVVRIERKAAKRQGNPAAMMINPPNKDLQTPAMISRNRPPVNRDLNCV